MIEKIKEEIKKLFEDEKSGHGYEHAIKVCNISHELAKGTNADLEIVSLVALLHDTDDQKIFSKESCDKLLNAHRIMDNANIDKTKQEIICDIISNFGYTKLLEGFRPTSLEGQIVSDADMLESNGAISVIRTIAFGAIKGRDAFDINNLPSKNFSVETYQTKARNDNSSVNHFFDKILRLKDLMFTQAGKKEAAIRHQTVVSFLDAFFKEEKADEWIKLLDEYR